MTELTTSSVTEQEATALLTVPDNQLLMGQAAPLLAHDAYDMATWNTTTASYQRLNALVEQEKQRLHTAPELLRDLFWSFYKAAPSFKSGALSPVEVMHRSILESV